MMWAAANDGTSNILRHHRHYRRYRHRRRHLNEDIDNGITSENNQSNEEASGENDTDTESETESISSTDGERSSTESITDNFPPKQDAPRKRKRDGTSFVAKSSPAKKPKRYQDETPEAVIARLTSSYSAAMSAVGALHQASQLYCTSWADELRSMESTGAEKMSNEDAEGTNQRNNNLESSDSENKLHHGITRKQCKSELPSINHINTEDKKEVQCNSTKQSVRENELSNKIAEASQNIELADEPRTNHDNHDNKNAENDYKNMSPTGKSVGIHNDNNVTDESTSKHGNNTSNAAQNKFQKVHQTIQRVANAARTALEQSLLLDPVILAPIIFVEKSKTRSTNFATTIKSDLCDSYDSMEADSAWLHVWYNTGNFVERPLGDYDGSDAVIEMNVRARASLSRWNRLSAAHRSIVKQIAYLALVNYADLLLCGCNCSPSPGSDVGGSNSCNTSNINFHSHLEPESDESAISHKDTLDRGAVKKLDVLDMFQSLRNSNILSESNRRNPTQVAKCVKMEDMDDPQYCSGNKLKSDNEHRNTLPHQSVGENDLHFPVGAKSDIKNERSALIHDQTGNTFGRFHSSCCLWSNERRELTLRLALASYCDASELDPSDPTLWFKLACAARALGREVDASASALDEQTNNSQGNSAAFQNKEFGQHSRKYPPKSYRCLERLALERGISSLPRGVPPNRILIRAWREMENRDRILVEEARNQKKEAGDRTEETMVSTEVDQNIHDCNQAKPGDDRLIELVINLPRYSWQVLGKILIRACREGAAYGRSLPVVSHVWSTNCQSPEDFEFRSPSLEIEISPLLTLPYVAFGMIANFLGEDSTDTEMLKRTCRVLPLELSRAKAKLKDDRGRNTAQPTQAHIKKHARTDVEASTKELQKSETDTSNVDVDNGVQDVNCGVEGGSNNVMASPRPTTGTGSFSPDLDSRRERVSKRVRSQMISSEKRTERQAKQSSVEYCLLAAVLSCTAENPYYASLLQNDLNWECLSVVESCIQHLPPLSRAIYQGSDITPSGASCMDRKGRTLGQVHLTDAVTAPFSLSSFVRKWNGQNSGPRHMLEIFLVHVSFYAGNVFADEAGDMFSTCMIDCFDLTTKSADRKMGLLPTWYGFETFEKSSNKPDVAMQVLAVNLLNAELRLKRCEPYDIESLDCPDDSGILVFAVSNLLKFVSAMSNSSIPTNLNEKFIELKCRCHWLASAFYFWWGRCSNDSSDSKAADELAMDYLRSTLTCLSQNSQHGTGLNIMTPQLESPHRHGDHWSILSVEVLSEYQKSLLSSSIVSRARQVFREIQSSIQDTFEEETVQLVLTQDQKSMLSSLGARLLERYCVERCDGRDKHEELLNDFILFHQDSLAETQSKACLFDGSKIEVSYQLGEMYWGNLWIDVPSSKPASNLNISKKLSRQSIIRVLTASLLATDEKIFSILPIFSRMVLVAFESRAHILSQGITSSQQNDIDEDCGQEIKHARSESIEGAKTDHLGKDHLLIIAANFFIDKMTDFVSSIGSSIEQGYVTEDFAEGMMITEVIYLSLSVSSTLHRGPTAVSTERDVLGQSPTQVHLFLSVSRLVLALRSCNWLPKHTFKSVESVYFLGLVKVFIWQKKQFCSILNSTSDKRLKKWQVNLNARADYIALVASEIADLMSLNPSRTNDRGTLEVSHLIKAITGFKEKDTQCLKSAVMSPITQFSETLLWFWKFLKNSTESSSLITSNTNRPERTVSYRLIIPISSAIVSLCGSPGLSVESAEAKSVLVLAETDGNNNSNFLDYFDSEDSVNGLAMPDNENDDEDHNNRMALLRKFHQLVQCVSLVFGAMCDKVACQETTFLRIPSNQFGPLLPLVVVRTLSNISDDIFTLFPGEKGVWSEQYPYGARTCGTMLDNILCKAYRCLYGFTLVGQHQNPFVVSNNIHDGIKLKNYAPESARAAVQLFRCIRRLYPNNRRTPPQKALETVAAAIPRTEETRVSKAIRDFLFDSTKHASTIPETIDLPVGFPEWVFAQADISSLSGKSDHHDIQIVQKGICHELAKGSITKLDSSQNFPSEIASASGDQGRSEERESTKRHELALYKKFSAVLDDLCYNPTNIEGWIVLSECLGFKADIICDRLVPIQESYKSAEFYIMPESRRQTLSTLTVDQLRSNQLEEFKESRHEWIPFLGDNLCLYIQYPWSTFSSLQALSEDIGSNLSKALENSENIDRSNRDHSDYLRWRDIQSKFEEGNFSTWASSWGGLFVKALRTMRIKALSVARYLAKAKQGAMHPAEVCEDIGTALYGDLIGSTVYGYPMHSMTMHEKRSIAESSKFFFLEAISLSSNEKYDCSNKTITWELQFMIGKCYEKVATSLSDEQYPFASVDNKGPARSYETFMKDATNSYRDALANAYKIERSSGGLDKNCVGGSSHGATEVLYRLHASRFKVLLQAVRRLKEERDLAELEALRITSVSWFDDSNNSSPTSAGIRGKIWDVLADTTSALVQCRIDIPLFHRAAYRLAQAFNWAPAFHDPDCDFNLGSRQPVPVTKSYRIRGLNTRSCAENAEVVIGSLFEKKREQLCSVWVTTSSTPPPFEVLNDTVRKFDMIRLKYIKAYIDCMLICQRKYKIETLLSWAGCSRQDLPGFYQASAAFRGGEPGVHTKEPLLQGSGFIWNVKRSSSRALAKMILLDLADMKKNGVGDKGKKLLTNNFSLAYWLFHRLNISVKEVAHIVTSTGPVIEVTAFCKCYITVQAGYRINDSIHFDEMSESTVYSLLQEAVSKAKEMFPYDTRKAKRRIV